MPIARVAETYGQEPLDLYYEVHGRGPNRVVLIGGFGNICHQWDLQVDSFMEEPDVYSVCIFDNRGGGFSSSPKGRYKTHEMAQDVKELMDLLGWRRFHVVGLSMGGMIAQELALLCLSRVISLTLESTFAYFNGLPIKGYLNMVVSQPPVTSIADFAANVVNGLLFPKEWLDLPAPSESGHKTNRENMIEFMQARFEKTGFQNKAGRASQQSAVITHSVSPKRLALIKHSQMPVLVITGTQDNVIIQPTSSRYLARHLGGRMEIFEGAGHAIRLQFPERHNALLKAHILGAVRKERDRLDDRVRSELTVLRGQCGGSVYEARAKKIRETLEEEWRQNGGRHHFVVVHRGIFNNVRRMSTGRRLSLHQSLSSLRRRKSRASNISVDNDLASGRASQTAGINVSLTSLRASLHDLFAPAEVIRNGPSENSTEGLSTVEHPNSSTFFSWLFPGSMPLVTVERDVVVEPIEFASSAFMRNEIPSPPTYFSTIPVTDSNSLPSAEIHIRRGYFGTALTTLRAVRVGFTALAGGNA
ncbi:hypothetical protein HK100_009016 [Physocladia obscura]|uniref:AB hydrolase-1 domain-containing protein n=1 Tax=Physocladia obscura TaxID=109957 RepID=A0AAD5XJI0_9FUNG|nr:hypothetical protein HK100_009016 [Physocladia obscura]